MGPHYFLKRQIEVKRKQMIQSAHKNGFTSRETVQYSQELDKLMNIYRRLLYNDNNSVMKPLGYVY